MADDEKKDAPETEDDLAEPSPKKAEPVKAAAAPAAKASTSPAKKAAKTPAVDEDDDDEDDEPPPPPKKKVTAKTTTKKKVAKKPARKVVRYGAAHWLPHALAGMGLLALHVKFDTAYDPIAVAGIVLLVYAYMQMGSVNEIETLGFDVGRLIDRGRDRTPEGRP